MTTTPGELLALADEIERSNGLLCMNDGLPKARQLGIKKTAQVIAALRFAAEPISEPVDLEMEWRNAGGAFHGPNVETGTMPKHLLMAFLRRLAAKPPDPDAMNELRVSEDAKLAENVRKATIAEMAKPAEEVREATIRQCAAIAKAHKGSYAKHPNYKRTIRAAATSDAIVEIRAEERGEDIASEIIERKILALSPTQEPKP